MIGTRKSLHLFLAGLLFSPVLASAQSTGAASPDLGLRNNPVAQVRESRSWEFGPFVNSGVGIGDRSSFKFFAPGFQVGKALTPVVHAGIASGQFELGGNLMPLWQAYTPDPHTETVVTNGGSYEAKIGGGTYTGLSLTPVILRWNFLTRMHHVQPWLQGAGGLIYTSHKFPPDQLVAHGLPGATSVFNFSPQGGIGFHFFTAQKRSIDLGINAVHISSASLGDRNPGVNASLQFQLGYTFWK